MTKNLRDFLDDGEWEKLLAWECPVCWAVGATALSRSNKHIKASCARCGLYARFCRQKLSADERAKWDAKKASR